MTGQEDFTMDGNFRFFAPIDINFEDEPKPEDKKSFLKVIK